MRTLVKLLILVVLLIAISIPLSAQDIPAPDNGVECPEKQTSDFESNWETNYRLAVYRGVCTDWIPWSNTAIVKRIPPAEVLAGANIVVEGGSDTNFGEATFAYDSVNGEWVYLGQSGSNDDFWDWNNNSTSGWGYNVFRSNSCVYCGYGN